MKPITTVLLAGTLSIACQAFAEDDFDAGLRWRGRMDIGGTIPEDVPLTYFAGPVSGEKFKLSPGVQFDLALDYRITPWLEVGPELGFTFNSVDSFGAYHHHDTTLFQMPIMANVVLEYPYAGRLEPYVGAGIGGVASFLTFGYDEYWGPDGSGSDFVLGFQAFAGLRYRIGDHASLGVVYRFMMTEDQNWDVEWWNGDDFRVSADGLRLHSICLVFSGTF